MKFKRGMMFSIFVGIPFYGCRTHSVWRNFVLMDKNSANFRYNKNFEISAFNESARQVGGDYFDVVKLDDNKTLVAISHLL